MTTNTEQFLVDILTLPESERLALASAIVAGIDGPPDGDWDATWLAELDRRSTAAAARAEPASEWKEVRARILDRLGR